MFLGKTVCKLLLWYRARLFPRKALANLGQFPLPPFLPVYEEDIWAQLCLPFPLRTTNLHTLQWRGRGRNGEWFVTAENYHCSIAKKGGTMQQLQSAAERGRREKDYAVCVDHIRKSPMYWKKSHEAWENRRGNDCSLCYFCLVNSTVGLFRNIRLIYVPTATSKAKEKIFPAHICSAPQFFSAPLFPNAHQKNLRGAKYESRVKREREKERMDRNLWRNPLRFTSPTHARTFPLKVEPPKIFTRYNFQIH